MEPRCLLSVNPIDVGVVYLEQDAGSDVHGDRFELTYSGGVEGTQLDRVVIDGDQSLAGFGVGDVFFDVASEGRGADEPAALNLGAHAGIDQIRVTVLDGTSQLLLEFTGFDPGERLVFEIDVDEVEDFDASYEDLDYINDGFDPITSGVEFQGSRFEVELSAPHFFLATGSSTFLNRYDPQLVESGLDLPSDNAGNQRDRTAAAFVIDLEQQAIPASLSGYVYHDRNDDGSRDHDEEGIAGVEVQLVPVATVVPQQAVTVTTDARGFYQSTGLAPGTYRVLELAQPNGFLDGQDAAGRVDGVPVGTAGNDRLDGVFLGGGKAGEEYNFGELLPVTLQGRVELSTPDGDCFTAVNSGLADSGLAVAGATVQLLDTGGQLLDETVTDSHGQYAFTGLRPGVYGVREITPAGLLDGDSHVGHIDGTHRGAVRPDGAIAGIALASGQVAREYNFCEHVAATLAGHVFHDRDNDGLRQPGDDGVAQVLVTLYAEDGAAVDVQWTVDDGSYEFRDLPAGTYTLVETHPSGWIDGQDAAGTVNGAPVGRAKNPGDRIENVSLRWGERGVDYDFGEFHLASIRGHVRATTGDGECLEQGTDQQPVEGAVVELLDAKGRVIRTTRTDAQGNFEFQGLLPGEYGLREITPDGLYDGGSHPGNLAGRPSGTLGDGGIIRGVRLRSGDNARDFVFCEHVPATLSGVVYHDRDNDGRRESGEEGIAEVLVTLYDQDGAAVDVQLTKDDGSYTFQFLPAGEYVLVETHPVGWVDGLDAAGSVDGVKVGVASLPGDRIEDVALRWGDRGVDYRFGEFHRPRFVVTFAPRPATGIAWNRRRTSSRSRGPSSNCWTLREK